MKTILKTTMLLFVTITILRCGKDDVDPTPTPTPTPTLSNINPESGNKDTEVTITGKDFGTDASKVKVYFNDTEATVQSVSNTQIKAKVPDKAGTGIVKVVIDGKTLTGPTFTYLEPVLSSINPESGPYATEVTVTGSTFGTDISKVQVFFNNAEAVVQSVNDTEIIVLVPETATTGLVKVDIDGTELTGPEFTVIPGLSGISPERGPKETSVTISGGPFGTDASKVKVFFNDKEADVQSVNNTEIIAIVPVKAFSGFVMVDVDGEELTGPWFTYIVTDVQVSTLAGSTIGYSDGTGIGAKFKSPKGITVDDLGNVFVADADNNRIRKITPEGEVSTLAGSDLGYADGTGADAKFSGPQDITIDASGNLYVADQSNRKIRKISSDGTVITFAGSDNGYADGPANNAKFNLPSGVAVDKNGNVYVADNYNHKIRKIIPAGEVSTLAGGTTGDVDGPGASARFVFPLGVAVDEEGNVYTTDTGNHKIRKITPEGVVSTLAGGGEGYADGPGKSAKFNYPTGIAVDKQGNVYVADGTNNLIRKIAPDGEVSTLAGSSKGAADGSGLEAQFSFPRGIAIDAFGDVYVSDQSNHRIRKITQE